MNILMLYPYDINELSEPWYRRTVEIAKFLTKRGHNVKLIYTTLRIDKINQLKYKQNYNFETIPLIRYSKTMIKKIKIVKELAKWADIIHLNKTLPWISIPAIFASLKYDIPIHLDIDDVESIKNLPLNGKPGKFKNFELKKLELYLYRYSSSISTSTHKLMQYIENKKIEPSKIFVIPTGLDFSKFNPKINSTKVKNLLGIRGKTVVLVENMREKEVVEFFLKIIKKILEKRTDITFIIIGGGKYFDELNYIASQMKISSQTVFTNFINHEEIPEYINLAKITVFCRPPTLRNQLVEHLVIKEYMAMAKPIIATSLPEFSYYLNDCSALIQEYTVDNFVEKINDLFDNMNISKYMGKLAYKNAKNFFSWEKLIDNFIKIYQLNLSHQNKYNIKFESIF